jgi:hypothetical protein
VALQQRVEHRAEALGELQHERLLVDRRDLARMRHGDTIYSETEVMEKRESRSRPQWGIVVFEHRARNQHGEIVMRCRRAGGRLRVHATVQDPLAAQAILAHLARSRLAEPPGPAPPAPAAIT